MSLMQKKHLKKVKFFMIKTLKLEIEKKKLHQHQIGHV